MSTDLFRVSRHRWMAIILLALILATSFVLFNPGIVMTDTMARWAAVFTITGKLNIGWSMEQWLQPTMTMFMLPIGLLGLPTSVFTAVQVGYLILACSLWITMTSSRSPFWIPLTFLLPLVFVYVSFIVPDVWTFAAIIMVVGATFAIEQGRRWTPTILFFISCIILFGFRQNSLVLIPAVFAMIFTGKTIPRKIKGLLIALIVLSVGLISASPNWLGFNERTSSAAAPAWELIGMLRLAEESKNAIEPSLTLEGITNTNIAIERHSFSTIDTLLWGEDAILSSGAILVNSDELKARWIRMIIHHPFIYAHMKIRVYECMLGLCESYIQTQVFANEPWPTLNNLVPTYNQPTGISGTILSLGNWMGDALKVMTKPFFWLPITLFVFLFNWKSYGRYDRWLIAMTGSYMASFFILNQAASFRYMFPVYVIFTAYQIRFIGWLLKLIWHNYARNGVFQGSSLASHKS